MKHRVWVLVACIVVIAASVLLAPALDDLHFEPARPLTRAPGGISTTILQDLPINESSSVWDIVIFWLAFVLPILLVVLLLPAELRRKLLQYVIRFALFILAMVLAMRYRLIDLPEIESGELTLGQPGFQSLQGPTDVGTYTPPQLPPWFTYLISLLLVLLLVSGAYVIYRFWQRTHSHRASTLGAIAAVARRSLDDLAEGRQWGDVIIEAYARMTDAVRSARGLHRDDSWTPREFAAHLTSKGLPASAVDDLTRLFEAARYGGAVADENARLRAASCLQSILQACTVAA